MDIGGVAERFATFGSWSLDKMGLSHWTQRSPPFCHIPPGLAEGLTRPAWGGKVRERQPPTEVGSPGEAGGGAQQSLIYSRIRRSPNSKAPDVTLAPSTSGALFAQVIWFKSLAHRICSLGMS